MSEDVFVQDQHISIGGYNVDLDKCQTPEQIVAWVNLLCERHESWITAKMVSEFVKLAAERINLNLYTVP